MPLDANGELILPKKYERPQPRGGQVPKPEAESPLSPLPVVRNERAKSQQP